MMVGDRGLLDKPNASLKVFYSVTADWKLLIVNVIHANFILY